MKIRILLALVLLTSCSNQIVAPEKTEYTIFIYAQDRSRFDARIDWGVNSLQDYQRLSGWGFATSVKLTPSEEIAVKSDTILLIVVRNNKTKAATSRTLYPSEIIYIRP